MKTAVTIILLFFNLFLFGQNVLENEEKEVPFAVIEDAPIFPGCESVEKSERVNCFQNKMQEHIKANLIYPRKALNKNIEGRVSATFVIDKEGNVTNIQSKGDPILCREAERILRKLPKLIPGKQKGKAIKVKFSQPFMFRIK